MEATNCLFLRTRETSTSSVGCACPVWRLRVELIEPSERQDRVEELAILKEEVWPMIQREVLLFLSAPDVTEQLSTAMFLWLSSGQLSCFTHFC